MALIDREQLTCIGVIQGAHGMKGELKVSPQTDTPAYYQDTAEVILETKAGLKTFSVQSMTLRHKQWLLALTGVATRSEAEGLSGALILLEDSALRPLEEGEYFHQDLLGCQMETLEGQPVGEVKDLFETGASFVLEVLAPDGKEVLVPLIPSIVKEVDTKAKRIRIDPIPGLLDD